MKAVVVGEEHPEDEEKKNHDDEQEQRIERDEVEQGAESREGDSAIRLDEREHAPASGWGRWTGDGLR